MDTLTEPVIAIMVPSNQPENPPVTSAKLFDWQVSQDAQGNLVFRSPSGKETKIFAD